MKKLWTRRYVIWLRQLVLELGFEMRAFQLQSPCVSRLLLCNKASQKSQAYNSNHSYLKILYVLKVSWASILSQILAFLVNSSVPSRRYVLCFEAFKIIFSEMIHLNYLIYCYWK